ncbi:MAG TPA: gliding motility-associated C-terminal domain-containing protein [Chitinophagaceae bacterium]
MGNNIQAPAGTCQWVPFSITWNSGDSSNAILSLVSQGGIDGSLFALDDISFAPFQNLYDSVNVAVAAYPNLKTLGDTTVCGPYPVPLSATGALHYSWSPGAVLSDSTMANPIANTSANTNYVVTAYNNAACKATDTVEVKVLPVPVFGLSPEAAEFCQDVSFTLTAQGGDIYQWSSALQGQGLSSHNSYSGTASAADTFAVIIYNSTCLLADTLHTVISVDTIPILTLTKSNDIDCTHPQAKLTAIGGNTYSWTPASSLSGIDSPSPIATPGESTWYTVSVTNGACIARDSIEVLVDLGGKNGTYSVPNAFTPNGDGVNDCFRVKYWGLIKTFELSVYNRWGERVFYTRNLSDCWDGTFKGIPQSPDTYVYVIKASSPCAASAYIFRKGTVLLIR